MTRIVFIAVMFLGAILAGETRAAEFNLTGTWTLQSMSFVDEATGRGTNDFGEHPKGYAIYTPGYMSVVINAEDRQAVPAKSPDAAALRARLLMTMTSHAGPYRVKDGVLINQVEVAHDPAMIGKPLVRTIKWIDADHYISTTPATERADGRRVKTVLTWQRAP